MRIILWMFFFGILFPALAWTQEQESILKRLERLEKITKEQEQKITSLSQEKQALENLVKEQSQTNIQLKNQIQVIINNYNTIVNNFTNEDTTLKNKVVSLEQQLLNAQNTAKDAQNRIANVENNGVQFAQRAQQAEVATMLAAAEGCYLRFWQRRGPPFIFKIWRSDGWFNNHVGFE